MENIKLLFQLYLRPASAMSDIIDRGSWLTALLLMLVAAASFYLTINAKLHAAYAVPSLYQFYDRGFETLDEDSPEFLEASRRAAAEYQQAMQARARIPLVGDRFFRFFSFEPDGFYRPVVSLSLFYVPIAILLFVVFGQTGRFGYTLQRDYGSLATCSMMAWTAAHLPFAVLGALLFRQTLAPEAYLAMWAASSLLFGVLMIFALRTALGAAYATALAIVVIGALAFTLGMYVSRFISPWLFSPFLLFYAYMYFGGYLSGEVRGFGNSFRQKQNFKRFLHNSTVNPRDSDAHVQLGLIYLERRQEAKALEHFQQALEIDPHEIDANYELGKLARGRGDRSLAIEHFSRVVEQNDKHALSEIWREIGATYLEAGMFKEARAALETYLERRSSDPEGLYYLGKVFKAEGETPRARELFEEAIRSAQTSPDFRRRNLQQWSKLARKEL